MAVKIKAKPEKQNLTPSKELRVFLTHKQHDTKYEVVEYDPKTHLMLLRNKNGIRFASRWRDADHELYNVTYKLRKQDD